MGSVCLGTVRRSLPPAVASLGTPRSPGCGLGVRRNRLGQSPRSPSGQKGYAWHRRPHRAHGHAWLCYAKPSETHATQGPIRTHSTAKHVTTSKHGSVMQSRHKPMQITGSHHDLNIASNTTRTLRTHNSAGHLTKSRTFKQTLVPTIMGNTLRSPLGSNLAFRQELDAAAPLLPAPPPLARFPLPHCPYEELSSGIP